MAAEVQAHLFHLSANLLLRLPLTLSCGLQTADETAHDPCPGQGQCPGGKGQKQLLTKPPDSSNRGTDRNNLQPPRRWLQTPGAIWEKRRRLDLSVSAGMAGKFLYPWNIISVDPSAHQMVQVSSQHIVDTQNCGLDALGIKTRGERARARAQGNTYQAPGFQNSPNFPRQKGSLAKRARAIKFPSITPRCI